MLARDELDIPGIEPASIDDLRECLVAVIESLIDEGDSPDAIKALVDDVAELVRAGLN